MWLPALILAASLNNPTILLKEPTQTTPPPLEGSVTEQCRKGAEEHRFDEAADACLKAVEKNPQDVDLLKTAAEVLFQADRGEESARCWKMLIDLKGWSCDAALKRANALWRAGDFSKAEASFEDSVSTCKNPEAVMTLLGFLEETQSYEKAARIAAEAEDTFPSECRISEYRAVAEDAIGDYKDAAASITRGLRKGCPPYRWAKMGEIPQHLDQAAYAPFFQAEKLVTGLAKLNDQECAERLLLLKGRMSPAVVQPVLDVLLYRKTSRTRRIALALISELGGRVMDAWKTLLGSDDFILRKYTLREIRKLQDPAFIPLLKAHLDTEKSPGNLDLTHVGLGELLYSSGEEKQGIAELSAVRENAYLYQPAQMKLAEWAEKRSDHAGELAHLENARAADPSTFLEIERLEELQKMLNKTEKKNQTKTRKD